MIFGDYYLSIIHKNMFGFNNINTLSGNSLINGKTTIKSDLFVSNNTNFDKYLIINKDLYSFNKNNLNNVIINSNLNISNLAIINNLTTLANLSCSNIYLNSNINIINDTIINNLSLLSSVYINDTSNINIINTNTISPINNDLFINAPIINIGNINSDINILGTSVYIAATDIAVQNKLININCKTNLSGINIGGLCGLHINTNNNNDGYIRTSIDGSKFEIKAPYDITNNFIASTDINYNLNISGTSLLQNTVTIKSNLYISQTANLNNISIYSNLYISGFGLCNNIYTTNLKIYNNGIYNNLLSNNLTVSNFTILNNNLTCNSLINCNNIILNKVTLLSNLISNNINCNNLSINSNININNYIQYNNISIGSSLVILGNNNINNCTLLSNLNLNNNNIIQNLTSCSSCSIQNNINVNGNTTLCSNLLTNFQIILPLKEYSDNNSAVAGGIPPWGFYRTGDIVKVCIPTSPPILTLLGSSNISIVVNDIYTDPGVTASDLLPIYIISIKDTNNTEYINTPIQITGSLTISTLNTSVATSYTITYIAVDNYYNIGSIKRYVTIQPEYVSLLNQSYFWVDAQDSTCYTLNNINIVTIKSKINNIIMSNLVNTPKIAFNILNNHTMFDFTNGSGIFSQNLSNSKDITIAIVVKFISSIGNFGVLWGHMSSTLGNSHDIYVCLRLQLGVIGLQSGLTPVPSQANVSSEFYYNNVLNKSFIFIGTLSNNATQRYLQLTNLSTNITVTSSYTNPSTLPLDTVPIYLGISEVGETSNAYIGECIYWKRVLSTTEINLIQTYLYNKWV